MLRHVSLLLLDHMLLSSVAMPAEMLEAAIARRRTEDRHYQVPKIVTVSTRESPAVLANFSITPDYTPAEVANTDLILVPALWRNPTRVAEKSGTLVSWLVEQHSNGAAIMTIGTGAWLPAQAGLLDGHAATTHWHALGRFQHTFPDVNVQQDHLLTESGRIYCAASINSGADLMIHLIGLFYGADIAHAVEQQFSPEVRNPFEKRVFREDASQHADEAVALAQGWIHQHWQAPLNSERMAAIAGVSERQLQRRFRDATGYTAGEYLMRLRCRYARDWLQNSDMAISDIAQLCGFSDASHLGRIFRRLSGASPGEYRRQVRSKLFSVD